MTDQGDGNRVLVVAAHPDDEVLGCGGTVALHNKAGDRVWSVIACEGESLRYDAEESHQAGHIEAARAKLGSEKTITLGFPDQRLDTLSLVDVITPLEQVVEELQPNVVYCHCSGDINRDHRILFEALLVAVRPVETCIEAILAFDTASSTEWGYPRSFVPDTWIDITTTLETKLAAMACYERELRDFPHPRSLEGLRAKAMAWGAQANLPAAEVFMTIRRVSSGGKTGF